MSKPLPHFKLFLILISLSILILILDFWRILKLPQRLIGYLTNPISFGLYQTRNNTFRQFHFIFQARFAAQENKALQEQIAKLLSENAGIRKKLAEADSLISQERSLDPATYAMVAVRPIGIGRYLKIDQGRSSGIEVGQAVVSNENLIGKIKEAGEKSANVQLLSDPDSKVAAFSQGLAGKSKGVLVGQFGTDILMDKILQDEKINVGDLVYSEGTEGYLPRGLILGRVIEVMDSESAVFKQAKVEPNFDISDLELVFVIIE